MSLFKGGIIIGLLAMVGMTLGTLITLIATTSLTLNQVFWKQAYFALPLGVLLIVVAVVIGVVIGGVVATNIRKQLDNVERQIRVANPLVENKETERKSDFKEIQWIQRSITELQERYQRQVLASQQLSEQSEGGLSAKTKEEILMNERQRLARELHDSVSQQLFAATMMLSAVNETVDDSTLPPMIAKQLEMIEKTINESQSEMRALLLHLRPVLLEGKSLQQGIEGLLRELQSKLPLEMTWKIEPIAFQPALENHLFRVVQELISNTMRHAKANHLSVYFGQVKNVAILRVVDDGKGFEVKDFNANPGSYGLQNVHERINEIGGTLKIISFPNKGTSVEIKIPIVEGDSID